MAVTVVIAAGHPKLKLIRWDGWLASHHNSWKRRLLQNMRPFKAWTAALHSVCQLWIS